MRSSRWEGTATALSSVAHGGETLGSVTYLRRETILQPDGRPERVPVVSGNAWRGLLRDAAADLLWEALGCPDLPLAAVATLWSGGALVKTAHPDVLSGARLARLRALVPPLMIFGGAAGGRIIEGALAVGKLLPVCQETAHVVPGAGPAERLPRAAELVQVEEYSRVDDTARPASPASPAGKDDQTDPGLLMRYGVETLAAGTRFAAWLELHRATAAQRAFFTEALDRWATGARVGGRGRAGHGRLALDLTERVLAEQNRGPEDPDWRGAVHRDHQAVLEAISALS